MPSLRRARDDETLGIIDWEHAAIGDPAYDLAIVTRGVRRPFQVAGGMRKLLDAYHARARAAVSPRDVHLYELCLMARFWEAGAREFGRGSAMVEDRGRAFRGLLERAARA